MPKKKDWTEIWIGYAQRLGYCPHCGNNLSTLTCSEIRELFRRIGTHPQRRHCPNCGKKIEYYSGDEIKEMFQRTPIHGGVVISGKNA